jgi:hypothetical protein
MFAVPRRQAVIPCVDRYRGLAVPAGPEQLHGIGSHLACDSTGGWLVLLFVPIGLYRRSCATVYRSSHIAIGLRSTELRSTRVCATESNAGADSGYRYTGEFLNFNAQ